MNKRYRVPLFPAIMLTILFLGITIATTSTQAQVFLTFRVDMSEEIAEGNFDIDENQVEIRGPLNEWSGGVDWRLEPSAENDSIYVAEFEFADSEIDSTISFKFYAIGGSEWESDIRNREYTITDEEFQTLPLALFNTPYWLYVTFLVDMEQAVEDGQLDIEKDSVAMRGTFQPLAGDDLEWGGNRFILEPVDDSEYEYLYGITIQFHYPLTANREIAWKFVIVGEDIDTVWESISNRTWPLGREVEQELPMFSWNVVLPPPDIGDPFDVTFMVDMEEPISTGEFDPEEDRLAMRGTFQPYAGDTQEWSGSRFALEPVDYNDKDHVYGITITFDGAAAGMQIAWKFVSVAEGKPTNWEGSGMPNRTWVLTGDSEETQVLPLFKWGVPFGQSTANVTFRADMRIQLLVGHYQPENGDYVVVTGPFNNWGNSDIMTEDPDREGFYDLQLPILGAEGDSIEYKFRIRAGDNRPVTNNGYEYDDNRIFVFTGDDMVLARRFWSDVDFENSLQREVVITFLLDRTLVEDEDGEYLEGELYMAGMHFPMFWLWDYPEEDRSHLLMQPSADFEDHYELTVTFPPGTYENVSYTYAVHTGGDTFVTESGFRENRIFPIPDDQDTIYVMEAPWGDWETTGEIVVSSEPYLADLPEAVMLDQNYPNPFNPSTAIRYHIPADTHVRLVVYDLLGRRVSTLIDDQVMAGSHRVVFDGTRLASGSYIYRLQAGDETVIRLMMLVK